MTTRNIFRSLYAGMAVFAFFSLISCGGSKPPAEIQKQETQAAQDQEAPTADAGGVAAASTLAITDIHKEGEGKYSATLNGAIVFKNLKFEDDKLYFPKSEGKGDKSYPVVFLEDRSIAGQIKDAIKAGKASGKASPDALKVTEVRWRAYEGGQGKLKGFADVTISSAVTIKGCKLLDGKNGLWVAWPSVKSATNDNEWDDLVFSMDKGVRDMVEAAVKKEAGM